jgi:DNA-binding response OmpR family regulator
MPSRRCWSSRSVPPSPTTQGPPEGSPKFVRATSVAEGLRLVSEEGPFDLAVVDLMLPDGDGTTVVREIKAQSPGTPVAVVSAS